MLELWFRGRGCVFGSSPKQLEGLYPEFMHWWLLIHSSPSFFFLEEIFTTWPKTKIPKNSN
jgi:hypothetical protein